MSEPLVGSPTNNCAEIQAARVAMELAIKAGKLFNHLTLNLFFILKFFFG